MIERVPTLDPLVEYAKTESEFVSKMPTRHWYQICFVVGSGPLDVLDLTPHVSNKLNQLWVFLG